MWSSQRDVKLKGYLRLLFKARLSANSLLLSVFVHREASISVP